MLGRKISRLQPKLVPKLESSGFLQQLSSTMLVAYNHTYFLCPPPVCAPSSIYKALQKGEVQQSCIPKDQLVTRQMALGKAE